MEIPFEYVVQCPACTASHRVAVGRPVMPVAQRFPAGVLTVPHPYRHRDLLECSECKLRYFATVPRLDALNSLYDQEESASFWQNPVQEKRKLTKMRSAGISISPKQSISVLDIGCHTGSFLGQLPPTWHLTGVDVSATAIRIVRTNLPNGFFYAGSLEDSELPHNSYDLVTAWDVFEHVHNVAIFVKKIHGLLRSGGLLVIETGNYASLFAKAAGMSWYYYSLLDHVVFYSPFVFRRILPSMGFENMQITLTFHRRMSWLRSLRSRAMAIGIASYTLRGRYDRVHLALSRAFGRFGTLPQPDFRDHVLVVARKD